MRYVDFSNILVVSIPILASILGIAFPIIVQTIGAWFLTICFFYRKLHRVYNKSIYHCILVPIFTVSGAGSGGQDLSHPGEQAVFKSKRNPVHRGAAGAKTGKRDKKQIPET
jgi:hypothetical protein